MIEQVLNDVSTLVMNCSEQRSVAATVHVELQSEGAIVEMAPSLFESTSWDQHHSPAGVLP